MHAHATVTIAPHGIELRCPSAGVSEDHSGRYSRRERHIEKTMPRPRTAARR